VTRLSLLALPPPPPPPSFAPVIEPWEDRGKFAGYIQYLALPLFDAIWLRFLANNVRSKGPAEMLKAQTPLMAAALDKLGPQWTPRAHWDAFFAPMNESVFDAVSARPFLPASFSYHTHNR
jgi:hypothetical protein